MEVRDQQMGEPAPPETLARRPVQRSRTAVQKEAHVPELEEVRGRLMQGIGQEGTGTEDGEAHFDQSVPAP